MRVRPASSSSSSTFPLSLDSNGPASPPPGWGAGRGVGFSLCLSEKRRGRAGGGVGGQLRRAACLRRNEKAELKPLRPDPLGTGTGIRRAALLGRARPKLKASWKPRDCLPGLPCPRPHRRTRWYQLLPRVLRGLNSRSAWSASHHHAEQAPGNPTARLPGRRAFWLQKGVVVNTATTKTGVIAKI